MFRDSETGVIIHRGVPVRSAIGVRLVQIVNLAFGVVYVLLGLRFLLAYLGARQVQAVELVNTLSAPFYRPFNGILAESHDSAGHLLVWSIVVALVAYAVLNALVVGLLNAMLRTHYEE